MLRLKKIAITGGVASGKSSVCRFFKELGAYVGSADAIAHELLNPNTDLGQQILRTFGPEIIEDGQISRRILAEKVFKDPIALKKLEGMLHPQIFRKIDEQYVLASGSGNYSSFVIEIPLLFETGTEREFDLNIAVIADEKLAKKRFEDEGFSKTEYDLRMKRQLSQKEKSARANYTITNNGSLDDLRKQVIELNRIIQNQ